MINDIRDMRLSELVDGELAPDDVNRTLLETLPDERARTRLLDLLKLRMALAPWRNQDEKLSAQPRIIHLPQPRSRWTATALAAAAALVFSVSTFVYVATRDNHSAKTPIAGLPAGREWVVASSISSDEALRVLQLHESITGPIAWLAVGSDRVQVQNMGGVRESGAIACFLNIQPHGDNTFPNAPSLIICRPDEKATLTIPGTPGQNQSMRIQLVPIKRDGAVGIQYAIGVEDRQLAEPYATTLSGFLPVSDSGRAVGQLAYPNTTLDVAMQAAVLFPESRG